MVNPTVANRRYAAILAADIAGYSALMGNDEDATVAQLKAHQADVLPLIRSHGGRVIDTAGDGILAEFPDPVCAVDCALSIQATMGAHNRHVIGSRQMLYRIGVHAGDVVFDDHRIYGDNVNIAARIEATARPGGICLSAAVYHAVMARPGMTFTSLGGRRLKNIVEPVVLYELEHHDLAIRDASMPEPGLTGTDNGLVVMPFDFSPGSDEQRRLADGLTEDITARLSRVDDLTVIAASTALTYRGQQVDPSELRRQLGVGHFVTGTVRRDGTRLRVSVSLNHCESRSSVWADRFDREMTSIFALQDDLTEHIVAALSLNLAAPGSHVSGKRAVNINAYDLFLRGRELMYRTNRNDNLACREVLNQALHIEPAYAGALAYLAMTHVMDYINQWPGEPGERSLEIAHRVAQQAVSADDTESVAYNALATTELWLRRHDDAIAHGRRATELDPNYAHGFFHLGSCYTYAGDAAAALPVFGVAMRLDPRHADVFLHWLALAHFQLSDWSSCEKTLHRRLTRNPHADTSLMLLASCQGHQGLAAAARETWRHLFTVNPGFSLDHKRRVLPYRNDSDLDRIVNGLHRAGIQPPAP